MPASGPGSLMETVVLQDALGQRFGRYAGQPRIVSLVPSLTELVVDLGLSRALVGRTGFCIHPHEVVRGIPKIGGTKDVRLDKLRALEPTHVLVNVDENRREQVDEIAQFVPHVVVTDPQRPEDNIELYRLLAGIFGAEEAAAGLCGRLAGALRAASEVGARLAPERVLYLIWRQPWMGVSPQTYISAMLRSVNWITLPQDDSRRYPEVAPGEPAFCGAQRLLLSTEPYRFRERHLEEVGSIPAWRGLPAQLIDGEMVSWYGSRAIRGLEYLARLRGDAAAEHE